MKNYFKIILFLLSFSSFGFVPKKPTNQNKEKKLLEIVLNTLKKKHLVSKKIDDNFSKKMFKTYIDSLDRGKLFLLQSDINEFKKYETNLDDQINKNDLSFFYITYDRLLIRMKESKEIYVNLLKNGLEFDSDEMSIDYDYLGGRLSPNIQPKMNKAELSKRWKDYLKTVSSGFSREYFLSLFETNYTQTEFNLLLKTKAEIVESRLEATLLNYDNISRDLIFEYYLNSIIVQFDVHSKYYIPQTRDQYLFKQSGKLEGAGITVKLVNDFVEVKSLMEGGPAYKTKKIIVGDVILKIQQENAEPENVVGYSIYKVAKLLKGKSGTTVKVFIKKIDGSLETVSIKREIVSTNDTFIKSALVVKNKVKYAVISFPRFYVDYDDDQIRNVVNDFEDELQILDQSDVQGIVLDMRNNGGGSVDAAVKILENFISNNPVVQYKNSENKINILSCINNQRKWIKSLVLIINNQTASASEIIASAFKDYKIGVTIGSGTFGKGTMQEFIDLNDFISKKEIFEDFGMLKITVNKFYKLNGNSIQKIGVNPEVAITVSDFVEREKNIPFSLKTDKVGEVKIEPYNKLGFFDKIINMSNARILKNDNFSKEFNNVNTISTLKKEFIEIRTLNSKKIFESMKNIYEKYQKLKKPKNNDLEFYSTTADLKLLKRKNYLFIKRNNWHNSLKDDFEIEEGLNILEDMYILKN